MEYIWQKDFDTCNSSDDILNKLDDVCSTLAKSNDSLDKDSLKLFCDKYHELLIKELTGEDSVLVNLKKGTMIIDPTSIQNRYV